MKENKTPLENKNVAKTSLDQALVFDDDINFRGTDPKTGRIISKKTAMMVGSGVLLAGTALGAVLLGDELTNQTNELADNNDSNVDDSNVDDSNVDDSNVDDPETEETVSWNPHTAPMVSENTVSDDMTYAEAFSAARSEVGPGGVFFYQGQYYGTFYEDEVNENHEPTVEYETVAYHDLPANPNSDEGETMVAEETDQPDILDGVDSENAEAPENDTEEVIAEVEPEEVEELVSSDGEPVAEVEPEVVEEEPVAEVIDYDGEVDADIPEDVPMEELDNFDDGMSMLDDGIDDFSNIV